MAKSKRSAQLDSKTKRLALAVGKSHNDTLGNGKYLRYYRPISGGAGSWLARWYDPETRKMRQERLGLTDDFDKADGTEYLDYDQAETKAKAWFKKCEKVANQEADGEEPPEGDWTVNHALDYYFIDARKTRKKEANAESDEAKVNANTRPVLGPIFVKKLTATRIKKWVWDLAERGRIKTGWNLGGGENVEFLDPPKTDEEKRKRKVTANKELARFKAAMNFCVEEGKLDADHTPWALVKAFKGVNTQRVRFLSVEEQTRLINAASPGFRPFVCGALMTGARYSELAATRARDLNLDQGKGALWVDGKAKDSRPRWIWLTEEGEEFFRQLAAGKGQGDLLFTHSEAEPVKRMEPRSKVAHKGVQAVLSGNEIKILEVLIQYHGQGVNYETLQGLWPEDPHRRRRVTGAIAQLKRKLAKMSPVFKGGRWDITFTLDEPQLLEFKGPVVGRKAAFEEEDGWRIDDAKNPLAKALAKAQIESLTFHELRHSYASDLVNRGVPLIMVAHQLGHADTQMVEKHYSHLCKTAEQQMIRQGGKHLGVLDPTPNVQQLQILQENPVRRKALTSDSEVVTPVSMNPVQRKAFTSDFEEVVPIPASLIRTSRSS